MQKLAQRGWSPAPPAEPAALRRRIYEDLTGLPPTLEEQARPLDTPDAVDALVEDLLARPTYGERWARHWLDLVRFAETNGYERDATKPSAWRSRDYVITPSTTTSRLTVLFWSNSPATNCRTPPRRPSRHSATTGWVPGTTSRPIRPRTASINWMTSSAPHRRCFWALTLGCARCHNHKFEPITAKDYYSMVALFNGLQRPRNQRTEFDLPAGTWAADRCHQRKETLRFAQYEKRAQEIRESACEKLLKSGTCKLPAEAVQAFLQEPEKRSDEQKKLVQTHITTIGE